MITCKTNFYTNTPHYKSEIRNGADEVSCPELSSYGFKNKLLRAEKNRMDFVPFLGLSLQDLKVSTTFVDKMFNVIERNNPSFLSNHSDSVTSFKAKTLKKNILTAEQTFLYCVPLKQACLVV